MFSEPSKFQFKNKSIIAFESPLHVQLLTQYIYIIQLVVCIYSAKEYGMVPKSKTTRALSAEE